MNKLDYSGQNVRLNSSLWPTRQYYEQLEKLQTVLNQAVYIIPVHQNQTSLSFSITSKALTLIAIIDYPLADPENHLFPHMLVFDDGTGINLGRILQVSRNRPFNPDKNDIIYKDKHLQQSLMFGKRQLNKKLIRQASRAGLAEILSESDRKLLLKN